MRLSPSQIPAAAFTLFRTFGARGLRLRTSHEIRKAAGFFKQHPRVPYLAATDSLCDFMRLDRASLADATDEAIALARADRVLAGEYQAYRWDWRQLPATSEEWLRHPVTHHLYERDQSWWKVKHLDARAGDIKELWEPARFGWSYDLTRAYLLTGNDRYAEAFHQRFAAWHAASPPFCGPHWSCGQETAIRAIALLYAEANLGRAPSSDDAASQRIASVLAASGERIADAIGYAVSQQNNHGISEAVGLLLLGLRFVNDHPAAPAWRRTGETLLTRLITEQFAADGWYVQHSFTYLRLALDQCILAQRALRANGGTLPTAATERLRNATRLLLTVVDAETGIVPNHGANDGAFVFPVTLAGYRDFRPVITAACAMFDVELPAGVPADTEPLAWLNVAGPRRGPPIGDGVWRGTSGWAAARVGDTFAFMRAGEYHSRPSHLDLLHVDVRFGSQEIIVDPGTYSYNAPPPWRNGLVTAAVHNGPILDEREPGIRGPRFLWYIWPGGRLLSAEIHSGVATIVAEIPSRARRTVRVTPDYVSVEDQVLAQDAERLSVRFTLHPDAEPAMVQVPGNRALAERGTDGDVAGWFSPYYGQKQRTTSVRGVSSAPCGTILKTLISRTKSNDNTELSDGRMIGLTQ